MSSDRLYVNKIHKKGKRPFLLTMSSAMGDHAKARLNYAEAHLKGLLEDIFTFRESRQQPLIGYRMILATGRRLMPVRQRPACGDQMHCRGKIR